MKVFNAIMQLQLAPYFPAAPEQWNSRHYVREKE
jgi:hypothetical protein